MKYKLYILLGVFLLVIGYLLYPKKTFEGVLPNEIYLCPNDKQILYVYEKEGSSYIYSFEIGDTVAKLLVKKEGYNLSEPNFSKDGSKIIYRAWKKNDPNILVYIADSDGSNPVEVYRDRLLFNLKFSEYDSNQIFFVKALEYSNHSPIVSKHPNGMDLYSYNMKSKAVKRHTRSNYYAIDCYDIIEENKFIVNSDLTGIYKYTLGSFKKEEIVISDKIDSSYISQVYSSRISYSKENEKYLLSTYFDVYLWNGQAPKLSKVYSSEPGNQIEYTSFFKSKKNILISTQNEIIVVIDYNGNILNRFHIPYPSSGSIK